MGAQPKKLGASHARYRHGGGRLEQYHDCDRRAISGVMKLLAKHS
jgi:hypothetical protein